MILAATDGYANSFRDDAGFLQVATDIWQLILEDGVDAVSADLEDWLREASERGSSDDISVGLLVRRGAITNGGPR